MLRPIRWLKYRWHLWRWVKNPDYLEPHLTYVHRPDIPEDLAVRVMDALDYATTAAEFHGVSISEKFARTYQEFANAVWYPGAKM